MAKLSEHNHLNQRNLLLEEERLLAARLCALRSRLNDMEPISSLPPEVMEEIFHYCVACLYDTQLPKSPLAWTQVCSRWRLISLNSTRLWQCIDLCNARFAKEFLLRCKQAPLSIVSTSLLKYHFESIPVSSNKLSSIDVFLFHADMIHLFSSIKDQLGSLTRLSLKVPPSKPLVLQDVSFPKVQHLSLDGVVVEWDQFHDLSRLSIRGLGPEYLPSISQLQGMLRRSPDLLSLRLEGYTPTPQPYSTSDTSSRGLVQCDICPSQIPLLRLCSFILCTNSTTANALFSTLVFGPSAKIQLFTSFDATEDLHSIFPKGLPFTSLSSSAFENYSSASSSPSPVGPIRRIRLSRSGIALITHDKRDSKVEANAWANVAQAGSDNTQPQKLRSAMSSSSSLLDPSSTSNSTILSISSASSSITHPLATRLCTSLPTLLTQQRTIPISMLYPNPMHQITHLELNTGVLLDLRVPVLKALFNETPNLEGLAVAFNDLSGLLSVLGPGGDSEKIQNYNRSGIDVKSPQPLTSSSASISASTFPFPPPPSPSHRGITHMHMEPTQPLLLPKLRLLTFSRPADLWWNFADKWLGLIHDCLWYRSEMGARVGKVEFYRCHGVCDESVDDGSRGGKGGCLKEGGVLGWSSALTPLNLEMIGRVKEVVDEVVVA
ncbi:hypothetical protein CVT24_007901 [Panaeolus cyanescens]|uniref:Uncharacterized protein n=1 Tax=Panaeolus cyanescens TaxID=181874 RepID=A0A409VZM2_9AGAR|nr:hypothetical protein CVT24_007901 [Panaeolus cyanescens]